MIIEMDSLDFVYEIGTHSIKILDILHWEIGDGDQVALYGPSGSGKSTLLYLLAGFLTATEGKLSVCGANLKILSEAERDRFRAEHIGFIFQNMSLLQGFTALENVWIAMTFAAQRGDRKEAEQWLTEVDLSDRLRHYPSQLSLGEQQRVAVARAMANRPHLVLADEPTASLDRSNKQMVINLLKRICERHGCTLVVVSHDPFVVDQFSHAVSFSDLNRTVRV